MVIDIVCGLLVGTSFYLGYVKGIIKSVFGILSIIIALLVTLKFSYLTIDFLKLFLTLDPRIIIIFGFVITFLMILIGIRMVGKGLENILDTVHLNIFNKVAGGLASACITIIVYSSLIWFLNQVRVISSEAKSASITYPFLESVPYRSKVALDKIKPFFSEFWQKTQEAMDKVDQSRKKEELKPGEQNK